MKPIKPPSKRSKKKGKESVHIPLSGLPDVGDDQPVLPPSSSSSSSSLEEGLDLDKLEFESSDEWIDSEEEKASNTPKKTIPATRRKKKSRHTKTENGGSEPKAPARPTTPAVTSTSTTSTTTTTTTTSPSPAETTSTTTTTSTTPAATTPLTIEVAPEILKADSKKKKLFSRVMTYLTQEYPQPPPSSSSACLYPSYSMYELDNPSVLLSKYGPGGEVAAGGAAAAKGGKFPGPPPPEPKYFTQVLKLLKEEGYSYQEVSDIPVEVLMKYGGAPVKPELKLNFFVSLAAFLRKRLLNFQNYCMVCHVKHSCTRDVPVVCCIPLCLFRYQQMRDLKEVLECEVCPYLGCSRPEELLREERTALKAVLYPKPEKIIGVDLDELVKLHNHKYLPDKDLAAVLKAGLHGGWIKSIVNVLQADLVPRFEKLWMEYVKKYPNMDVAPKLGWHGTKEQYIDSITKKGLIVPGKDGVTHSCDTGWWGKGIYIAPVHTYSIGYMYGGTKGLFLCSILMGKSVNITDRIDGQPCKPGYDSHIAQNGQEWVLFDEAQVLPCYLIEVQRGGY